MDRFLAPHSPEAAAHTLLTENWFYWDLDHANLNENLVAGCASYRAFDRYLSGQDMYLLPRTRSELERILRRYAYDAIHNAIAKCRAALQPGGYGRVCYLAEKSISDVLNANDNAESLLRLHYNPSATPVHESAEPSARSIPTK
ncbi:hypothetical protein BDN72DRAFT_831341 [Pluteus cervinus]|uniref:Uncharacterized protein n=1 Tax=Pluteus cervinus TaxID=181527 RepID=A0ACD3BE27_9AGAR|nr:hypothetical protein BDN72DRAFT_831341 [Pluteus cervinus]